MPVMSAIAAGVGSSFQPGGAARAFLDAGLVDRLLIYRAPRVVGGSGPALPDLIPAALSGSPHWRLADTRQLGKDRLEVYERS